MGFQLAQPLPHIATIFPNFSLKGLHPNGIRTEEETEVLRGWRAPPRSLVWWADAR